MVVGVIGFDYKCLGICWSLVESNVSGFKIFSLKKFLNKELNITAKPSVSVWFSTYFYGLVGFTKIYHFTIYIYIYIIKLQVQENLYKIISKDTIGIDSRRTQIK